MSSRRALAIGVVLFAASIGCRRAGDDPGGGTAGAERPADPAAEAAAAAAEQAEIAALPADAPRIDVAFCLDGTGSMGSVIEGAKAKIEEIAAWLRRGTPSPRLRFGLVVFRDRGEAEVVKNLGFVDSAAAMKRLLGGVAATGGGDGPEHVVAGLRAAVVELPWDPAAALRGLFLIGDAEPHLDYGTDSDDLPVLETARQRKIAVSTIACGEMSDAGHAFWKRVAAETGGVYQALPGTTGAPVMAEMEFEEAVFAALRGQAGQAGIRYHGATPASAEKPRPTGD